MANWIRIHPKFRYKAQKRELDEAQRLNQKKKELLQERIKQLKAKLRET